MICDGHKDFFVLFSRDVFRATWFQKEHFCSCGTCFVRRDVTNAPCYEHKFHTFFEIILPLLVDRGQASREVFAQRDHCISRDESPLDRIHSAESDLRQSLPAQRKVFVTCQLSLQEIRERGRDFDREIRKFKQKIVVFNGKGTLVKVRTFTLCATMFVWDP
jgi:hypothetical protein